MVCWRENCPQSAQFHGHALAIIDEMEGKSAGAYNGSHACKHKVEDRQVYISGQEPTFMDLQEGEQEI